MTDISDQEVIAHLKSKWNKPCPMCGIGNWGVNSKIYQLTEFHSEGMVVGGPVVPVVPIVCKNCGNTILVNAIVSGIMKGA